MRLGKPIWLGAALALLLAATVADAHAFRCGTRVISRGDQAIKLLELCGEPDSVQSRLAQRSVVAHFGRIYPGFVEDIVIEEWTSPTGWPEFRIILLGEERRTICLADNHDAAVTAARSYAEAKGLPFADLSEDDYAR